MAIDKERAKEEWTTEYMEDMQERPAGHTVSMWQGWNTEYDTKAGDYVIPHDNEEEMEQDTKKKWNKEFVD